MRRPDDRRFRQDLETVVSRLALDVDAAAQSKLQALARRLRRLHRRGLVKINHSVMELVCARHLTMNGYEVRIEHPLEQSLVCDLFASKGDGTLLVEVETGYTPPEHALDPDTYSHARLASKIARYSAYATKFALATPPHNILQIPRVFMTPPRDREAGELEEVKALCDRYYTKPPVSLEQIRSARVHSIYILNVDAGTVREIDPKAYQEFVASIPYL